MTLSRATLRFRCYEAGDYAGDGLDPSQTKELAALCTTWRLDGALLEKTVPLPRSL